MTKIKPYENFPLWIPFAFLLFSILSYMIGAIILIGFGVIIAILYLAYCLGMELFIILRSCKNCYYYGKLCGIGKGKIAPLFVEKGDTKKFTERKIKLSDLIPDFLIAIIPIAGGIILSILSFSLIRIGLIIILIILFFAGNALIRGSLACKYCKQKELGCPAEEFFDKNKPKK